MAIQIASNLESAGGSDFFLLEDAFIKGGIQVVSTVAERDAIPLSNLKLGSLILCLDSNTIWQVSVLEVPSAGQPNVVENVDWVRYNDRSVVSSTLPPVNPFIGQFWHNVTEGNLYLYIADTNSNVWFQV